MPNWCHNLLSVEGDEKQLKKFRKDTKTKETELSMGTILPCPQELEDTKSPVTDNVLARTNKKKYGEVDWYHWNIQNWGTK